MTKAQVFILVAVLFFGKVQAQQCYSCLSITSDSDMSAFPSTEAGFVPCDENYTQSTMNCSAAGGCLTLNYNLLYNIEGQGRVNTNVVIRTCGAALDVCETVSTQDINAQLDLINDTLLSTIQFVSGNWSACNCTDNLCNGGNAMEQMAPTPSLGAPATTLRLGAPATTPSLGAPATTPSLGAPATTPSLGAPATTLSIGALLASLLLSYIAMKR